MDLKLVASNINNYTKKILYIFLYLKELKNIFQTFSEMHFTSEKDLKEMHYTLIDQGTEKRI